MDSTTTGGSSAFHASQSAPARVQLYAELPRYLAGWDVAILPLALNEAMRSSIPAHEYLAAGRRVVSTAIHASFTLCGARAGACGRSKAVRFRVRRRDDGRADHAGLTVDLYVSQESWVLKDLSAIGEKFSAENVKHETRELVNEAKEAVVEKLREVKADALESVNETLHEVGASARRAGEASYGYARANAIPLAMIGLGIGWLAMSSRGRRRRSEAGFMGNGTKRLGYERGYAAQGKEWEASAEMPREHGSVRNAVEGTLERAGNISSRAGHRVEEGVEYARKRARELGHGARDQFVRAEHTAVDFGRENPLAIGALALAAGVGVGLLLPSTEREDELLGAARDRMVGEVTGSVEGLKRTAKGTAHDVSDAFREVTRG